MSTKKLCLRWFCWASIATMIGFVPSAIAHHVMGGSVPDNLLSGLVSGIGHPLIGFDHLIFVAAVGFVAMSKKRQLSMPLVFVGATLSGCVLFIIGWVPSSVELAVSASLLILGTIMLLYREWYDMVYYVLFAVAGLCHGVAYGEPILGAEVTSFVAYLAGFTLIQYVIAVVVGTLANQFCRTPHELITKSRVGGVMVLATGVVFVAIQLENSLLL